MAATTAAATATILLLTLVHLCFEYEVFNALPAQVMHFALSFQNGSVRSANDNGKKVIVME